MYPRYIPKGSCLMAKVFGLFAKRVVLVPNPFRGKQPCVKVDEVAANSTRILNLVSVTEEEKY